MDKETHISNIKYFHKERSIERYAALDEALEMLPELKFVYQNYKVAKLALEKAIENL